MGKQSKATVNAFITVMSAVLHHGFPLGANPSICVQLLEP